MAAAVMLPNLGFRRLRCVRRPHPDADRRAGPASWRGPQERPAVAFHILTTDREDVDRLASALREVAEKVRFCDICFNVSEETTCRVCRDPRR